MPPEKVPSNSINSVMNGDRKRERLHRMSRDRGESGVNKLHSTCHRKGITFPTLEFRVEIINNEVEVCLLVRRFKRET